MAILEVGCCGAYCKTCPELIDKHCKGCKIGYADGTRDIAKAKCKMKVCCIQKGLNACADCKSFPRCETIQNFHNKKSYKYKKYKESSEFIRERGYKAFLKLADTWTRAYGKLR